MNSSKRKAAGRKFTHGLLYPGVLGSMIFDLLDPLRDTSITQLTLFFISCIFATDFLHLFFNIEYDPKKSDLEPRPIIDAVIAVSFCIGFFSVSATTSGDFRLYRSEHIWLYQGIGLTCVSISLVLASYYDFSLATIREKEQWIDACGKLVPALLCFLAAAVAFVAWWYQCDLAEMFVVIMTFIGAASYFFYVIYVASERKVPKLGVSDRNSDVVIGLVSLVGFIALVWAHSEQSQDPSTDTRISTVDVRLGNVDQLENEMQLMKPRIDVHLDVLRDTLQTMTQQLDRVDSEFQELFAKTKTLVEHVDQIGAKQPETTTDESAKQSDQDE